jgi:hypothetical protein
MQLAGLGRAFGPILAALRLKELGIKHQHWIACCGSGARLSRRPTRIRQCPDRAFPQAAVAQDALNHVLLSPIAWGSALSPIVRRLLRIIVGRPDATYT